MKKFLTGRIHVDCEDGAVTIDNTCIDTWLSRNFDGKIVNITVEEEEEEE